MRFVQGDVVSLKGTKNPMNVLVVLERVSDDLVKVCNLDGAILQLLPIKALNYAPFMDLKKDYIGLR